MRPASEISASYPRTKSGNVVYPLSETARRNKIHFRVTDHELSTIKDIADAQNVSISDVLRGALSGIASIDLTHFRTDKSA